MSRAPDAAGRRPDDATLARRAAAGDETAFRDLVHRFERPVFSLIVRMVRDAAVAEELAQDAFLKAYAALDRYDGRRKLSSWLFKIAHNTAIDHLRRHQPSLQSLDAADDDRPGLAATLEDLSVPSPHQTAEGSDLARDLEAALGELRADYREVLVLRFQEGLAYGEIAEVTELPLGTVKTHLHRARKELIDRLGERGWGPP